MAYATPVLEPHSSTPVYSPSGSIWTTDPTSMTTERANQKQPQPSIHVPHAVPAAPSSTSPVASASLIATATASPVTAARPQATTVPWTTEPESSTFVTLRSKKALCQGPVPVVTATATVVETSTVLTTDPQSSTFIPKNTRAWPVPSPLAKPPTPPPSTTSWEEIVAQSHLPELKEGPLSRAKGRITFSNLRKCGKGGFGQIFKARANNFSDPTRASREYALKRQMLNTADSKCSNIQQLIKLQQLKLEGLRREAKVYFSSTLNKDSETRPDLACPHLALLSDVAYIIHNNVDGCDVKEPLLAMEWANAPHNTLRAWMKQYPVCERGMRQRLSLAIQMFSGLVELHYGGHNPYADAARLEEPPPLFVHQDLKPANMLLFQHSSGVLRLALTDFGLTVCYNGSDAEAKCGGGTHTYMAPEQRLGLPARTPSRDIWAAGLVLAELFGGKRTQQALKDHRQFSSTRPIKACLPAFIQKLQLNAAKIASDIAMDAEESQPTSPSLSTARLSIHAMLLKCFRLGRETRGCMQGVMSVGHARPTSWQCEAALKYVWEKKLGFSSWKDHQNELPMPRKTALQRYDPHQLMEFYYEHMETGMVQMMIGRYKRLIGKVDPKDQRILQTEIQRLKQQVQDAQIMKLQHHRKSQEALFQKY